jgi:ABC-type multidrug transport system ATPase subunit
MGYCPQFDALHELLTAEETLSFYARIRGVPERAIASLTQQMSERLTLTQDNQHKRPCGTYSGGNKRKLSVAIALIGAPPIVLLDEPSTGMDPVSRRFMWDFISETMADRAVILTTHSMEECEALCQRIGMLVHGQLKCLGTSQHLKTRFGKGFQIQLNVDGTETLAQQAVEGIFDRVDLLESYAGSMKFKCEHSTVRSFGEIFTALEKSRTSAGIIDYSVSQMSLEQIFINFAKGGEGAGSPVASPAPMIPYAVAADVPAPQIEVVGGDEEDLAAGVQMPHTILPGSPDRVSGEDYPPPYA